MRPQFQLTFALPYGDIRIDGDLDFSSGDAVAAAFESLQICGASRIRADLTGVTFVDAYGLGLLRGIQRRLMADDGYVEVVAASDRYIQVCRLAHYDTLLPARAPVPPATIMSTAPLSTGRRTLSG
ncbi:anti-anti-sigma factor [Nocardioides terrae]|uniref:Anti-anti-sigma factor n=1 Tax=Nocardioides terrae TaxID=574651 RepID=A0A1I1KBQ9_9ACTN|nr:STAS domain-containing protein [Nocardioides terrae]SFC57762.1 anti-anti-sigma factor [Nocardioides terrae]